MWPGRLLKWFSLSNTLYHTPGFSHFSCFSHRMYWIKLVKSSYIVKSSSLETTVFKRWPRSWYIFIPLFIFFHSSLYLLYYEWYLKYLCSFSSIFLLCFKSNKTCSPLYCHVITSINFFKILIIEEIDITILACIHLITMFQNIQNKNWQNQRKK